MSCQTFGSQKSEKIINKAAWNKYISFYLTKIMVKPKRKANKKSSAKKETAKTLVEPKKIGRPGTIDALKLK